MTQTKFSDLKNIAYINIQNEQLKDTVNYAPIVWRKITKKIPLMNLVTDLNWAFLSQRKRPVTISNQKSDYWINMGIMRTGKRKGDPYAFMFIEGYFIIITQSRPAGSYKIMGKKIEGK